MDYPSKLSNQDEEKGGVVQAPDPLESNDPSSKMWAFCISQAEKHDTALAERWKADMDGILIYTGVFSATVAAFIIESYKLLKPDFGEQSVRLLGQVTGQLTAISNGTPYPLRRPLTFGPDVMCLFLGLSCALLATLVQQWTRRYLRLAQYETTQQRRVRIRTYLFHGMHVFHTRWVVENISLVMHAAIFLFFAGLIDFLFAINDEVARVVLVAFCVLAAAYIVVTALPVIYHQCPYQTPLTSCIWYSRHFFAMGALCLFAYSKYIRKKIGRLWDEIHGGFYQYVVDGAEDKPENDEGALKLALTSCGDDDQLETFIEAIPSYLRGEVDLRARVDDLDLPAHADDIELPTHVNDGLRTRVNNIGLLLKTSREDPQLGRRVVQLLVSCVDVDGTMDNVARRRRAITCAHAIRELARTFSAVGQTVDIPESACKVLHRLSQDHDPKVALAALSAIAILEHALLKQLSESDKRKDSESDKKKDPGSDEKTENMLKAIHGEWYPVSVQYQHGQSSGHGSDGRLITVAKFISSILALTGRMGHPSHEELDGTRRTLVELCRGLHREVFSTPAQHSFANSLGRLMTHAAAEELKGMRSLRSV
ncbi:hypothetical protein BJV78DRAFT_1285312 [Lactifluus subvellereus]|nr:hypothetical protein BJV78DRAFT_1285312 [Lactifluus subvellereus]